MNLRSSTTLAGIFILAFITDSPALFMEPDPVPVDRLVKNAETYLQEHPNEADAHYTLARIHYLAFALQVDKIPASLDRGGLHLTPWLHGGVKPMHVSPELPEAQAIEHAARAYESFEAALAIDPKSGRYHLGFASLLEQFVYWRFKAYPERLPPKLDRITLARARIAYAEAFALAHPENSKIGTQPMMGGSIVAYEAAQGFTRLAREGPMSGTGNDTPAVLQQAKEAIPHYEKLPRGMITPIVFSFQPTTHLDQLLAPKVAVDFDLRGYGARERWPWVKPELGFLVWDPAQTGCITSGRQLFGSYTFQIFWKTGYDALHALDNNRDGVLSGAELDGIRAWFDRNSDGHSTPDEVVSLQAIGVVSVATRAESHDGRHPTNPHGLTLHDGRRLRTWDWMVEPTREER